MECKSRHFLTWLPYGQGSPATYRWKKLEMNCFSSDLLSKDSKRLHYLGAHVRQSVVALVLFLLWLMMCYFCCSQNCSHLQSMSVIKCRPWGKSKMLFGQCRKHERESVVDYIPNIPKYQRRWKQQSHLIHSHHYMWGSGGEWGLEKWLNEKQSLEHRTVNP